MVALSHKQFSPNTWDDIMEIVAWSLQHATAGLWPLHRHDREAWQADDVRRKKTAGSSLGARGLLVEVRGDWKMFSEVFRFQMWSQHSNICWLCAATKNDVPSFFFWGGGSSPV